jgi:hypothetical protein
MRFKNETKAVMNNLLNHLSWSVYLQITAILLVSYYIVIGLKFYRNELIAFFNKCTGRNDLENGLPDALIYEEPMAQPGHSGLNAEEGSYVAEADSSTEIIEEFIGRSRKLIEQAALKTYSPAALIYNLQQLFTEYPQLKSSAHRTAIGELIADACGQNGTAELSEDEVDAWWDELHVVASSGPGISGSIPDTAGTPGTIPNPKGFNE